MKGAPNLARHGGDAMHRSSKPPIVEYALLALLAICALLALIGAT